MHLINAKAKPRGDIYCRPVRVSSTQHHTPLPAKRAMQPQQQQHPAANVLAEVEITKHPHGRLTVDHHPPIEIWQQGERHAGTANP